MATIVFSALGTALGGPLGGAIGALVGRQVDGALLGGRREGPRLKDLAPTTSTYGAPIARHFGRMRVPGQIIWATDLVEHSDTEGGKGRPSVTSYTYTASFAVALASRPIADIGRIWADGNLLRGEAGDLKAGGAMRVHTGEGDQPADPLIVSVEGEDRCPAWRGTAYVVFENLELGDFFNRIPTLTFEVIADEDEFGLQDVVGALPDADAGLALEGVAGLTCEGPLADTLRLLEPVFPMECDAGGVGLTIARARLQGTPLLLPAPAIAVHDDAFGGAAGFARRHGPAATGAPAILRYYDLDRDYQPGLQRATGRSHGHQSGTLELPLATTADNARILVESAARRALWRRETIEWRCAQLDRAIAPGAIVELPGRQGLWRVEAWEWREAGVELALTRVVPPGADAVPAVPVDAGRFIPASDLPLPPTVVSAFELPWDGLGSGDTPAVFAAVSSPAANWSGAALYADRGGGQLDSLGPSGRTRSVMGRTQAALDPASPLLLDRVSSVTVSLIDPAMDLAEADSHRLAQGANRALVGQEIVQFARATPLGDGVWRLDTLLRGRGGTEWAVGGHEADEAFVLLDGRPSALDPIRLGEGGPASQIAAVGRADPQPLASPVALSGITREPLSPVHARIAIEAEGIWRLAWTRRARGAWHWADAVDVPLNEETEAYRLSYGAVEAPIALWDLTVPEFFLTAAQRGDLSAALPGGTLQVRQIGRRALSRPLFLATLP